MIIIIDEASAKLASFYYHDEILKPQWKRAVEMTSAPAESSHRLYLDSIKQAAEANS